MPVIYYTGGGPDYKEVGLDYISDDIFLRDEHGNIVEEFPGGGALLDFTLPQTQQWVKDQVLYQF